MAHFAKVLDGKVINVIVAEPEFFDTFVDSIPGDWIQTSYNIRDGVYHDPETGEPVADQAAALAGHPERQRKNYAGVGMIYDRTRDAFYYPKPFPSWVLNEDTCKWEAPITKPSDETSSVGEWQWDETAGAWVELTNMPR